MVALLLAVAWFRLYTHYFAEFSLLHLMRVPVLEFSAKGHTVSRSFCNKFRNTPLASQHNTI